MHKLAITAVLGALAVIGITTASAAIYNWHITETEDLRHCRILDMTLWMIYLLMQV